MRVTASTFYKDYAKSVQDLKSIYNKSMQQVSSGKKYENAYDSPLDYYAGKRIDNLYNDVTTKSTMIKDVINRLEQQETTSRTFYSEMSDLNIKYEEMASSSYQGLESTVDTMYTYMLNKQQTMTQDLNATYENYYIMGGNDQTTIPFTMSEDGMTLSYHHKFPGEDKATVITMEYDPNSKSFTFGGSDKDGNAMTSDQALSKTLTAMREQGRMSLGYGDINTLETLPDTYYGGLNMVTGLTSDKLRAMSDADAKTAINNAMNTSAFGLNAQALDATKKYYESFSTTGTTTSTSTSTSLATLNSTLEEIGLIDNDTTFTFTAKGAYIGTYTTEIPSSTTIGDAIDIINSKGYNGVASFDESTGQFKFQSYTYPTDMEISEEDISQMGLTFTGDTSGPPIVFACYTSKVYMTTSTSSETVTTQFSQDEIDSRKAAAAENLNKDLAYVIGNWDHAMIDVSNTFRRIGVATSTLEEVDNQLQTAQDTYIKEYNDHMAIDTYDAIVQMYQHQYAYNAAMQVGSKIMQNSLFDFVQ